MKKNFIDTMNLIEQDKCPITGLPICCKDSWKKIRLTSNYEASFAIIGENILLSIPKGDAGKLGKKLFIEKRNLILKEAAIWEKKHIEIKDYQYIGRLISADARKQFTNHMIEENGRGFLQHFIGFNAHLTFQFMLSIGKLINTHKEKIPMEFLATYQQSILKAQQSILNPEKKIIGERENQTLTYQDDIYKLTFKLIDHNIVYNEAAGKLLEPQAKIFIDQLTLFLKNNSLWGKEYFRIANWEGLSYSSWTAKKNYIKGISNLQKTSPCIDTAIYNIGPIMKNILKIGLPLAPFKITFLDNFEDSLNYIKEVRSNYKEKKTLNKKIYTEDEIETYSMEIINKIKEINWDTKITDDTSHQVSPLSLENPFTLIYEAITLLKMDIEHAVLGQVETERKLYFSNKLASLGELAAGVSHEINNPLSVIIGHVSLVEELLKENPKNFSINDALESLEKIRISGFRIRDIVSSLKNHGRRTQEKITKFNLEQATHEAVNLAKNLINPKKIEFKISINPLIEPFFKKILIQGERQKFQQVLFNLFNNSKDAIEEKNRHQEITPHNFIEISFFKSSLSENKIAIYIKDSGMGIKKENLIKIFDAFYTTRPIGQGTGLGLSIVHSILTEMEGSIEVESDYGNGTVFKIHLPLYLED